MTLLVESREGYKNLCKLITAAADGKPKGEARATWEEVARHAAGLHVLTGSDESPLARLLDQGELAGARALLERLAALFPGRLHVELQRHGLRGEERRNQLLVELAERLRLPLLATQGARYARREEKPLHDILTAIRHHVTLDAAGSLLAAQRERHLKSAPEIARLFPDLPGAVAHARELGARLDFTLADLGYRFPDYPLPPGATPTSYLAEITWNRARARFRPLSARAQAQIERELALIAKLDLAGYFLIVWDLVEFCRRERILCQGRGSAANSAVCYALGITAIDPVKMELLFERFLSEERGEWPDIDLDLPSGDQREKVIQYVYRRYGGEGSSAAMTANVITYRDRMAAREVAKVLGYSESQVDRLAKQLGHFRYDLERGDDKRLERELAAAGFDPAEGRNRHFATYWRRIQNLPRHLGQHSGGMVIAAGRLDEVVPLEPAAMPGRTIVQWDKDDCADLGLIKVDLLGLGMLNALEEAIPIIREHERQEVDLAHLPADDPGVYAMLRAADTVGVFQVESRAQMASLPRNAPEKFYDLVIQVAIIRPGPITGGMVHPFFERRLGREEVTYFHPVLEPILKRTLGVPIFQEQLLRMAMAVSGFSGGEAEELRRAMGFKRSVERMQSIEQRLRAGMAARGIAGETQDRIVQSITSFALYGFPESHAASFALIAYASAYLKRYHPTAFLIALLNAWPMGFYHPASLVKDAQRHGVTALPIDVNHSDLRCCWEEGACRIGLRYVSGLRQAAGERIAAERARGGPYADVEALKRRAELRDDELARLAEVGALASLGLTRRAALWQAALAARPAGALFEEEPAPEEGIDVEEGGFLGRQRSPASGPISPRRDRRAPFEGQPGAPASASASPGRGRVPMLSTARPQRPLCGELRPDAPPPGRTLGARETMATPRGEGRRGKAEETRRASQSVASRSATEPSPDGRGRRSDGISRAGRGGHGGGDQRPVNRLNAREVGSPLPEMTPFEETAADFAGTGLTVGAHPMVYARAALARQGVVPAAEVPKFAAGTRIRTAGAVIVRQRPGTANGTLFLTLEDETGMVQAIVRRALLLQERAVIVGNPGLVVEGVVQNRDGSVSLQAERLWPLTALVETPSHDFH